MRLLASQAPFRVVNKSTQVGVSFSIAVEGLDAAIFEATSSNYISVNEREARDKIRYARAFYDGYPAEVLDQLGARLIKDTDSELGFGNGSRLLSLPASAGLRGRSGNTYLDEVAHYAGAQKDTDIYDAAIGRTTRENLRLTLTSTPFGQRGIFYEVYTDREKYPDYAPFEFPYTVIEDRAWLDKVELIRRNMDENSFEQEYMCRFIGDSGTYFSYNLINGRADTGLVLTEDISELHTATGRLYAGYDVGRKGHASVLAVIEKDKKTGHLTLRFMKTYKDAAWSAQKDELRRVLMIPQLRKLSIDATGMGLQLAEEVADMARSRVNQVNFVAEKTILAETAKMAFEKNLITIANDRALKNEIHSIEKTITNAGARFDTTEKKKHHADRFWALCMAIQNAISETRRMPRLIII